jgi:hypothetical protein
MSTQLFRILTALCGVLGAATLVTSFTMTPGPPTGVSIVQVITFIHQYHDILLMQAWLQATGAFLNVLFVIAIIHLANATTRLAGWITMVAGTVILMVSLLEVTFYLSVVQGSASGNPATITTSLDIIKAVQHLFLIAPALFLPLGIALLGSHVLPQVFGYLALVIGVTLQILGVVGLFNPIQNVIDNVLIVQELWTVAAAITLIVRVGKASVIAGVKQ